MDQHQGPEANAVAGSDEKPIFYLANTRRNKHYDKCNLCLNILKLTDDHVPPQGATNVTKVEVQSLQQLMAGEEGAKYYRSTSSQNGLKFRTLCGICNSWLGHSYDPELIKFSWDVRHSLNSLLALPATMQVEINPDAVIRAVLGHLVASKVELDDAGIDRKVRTYLSDGAQLPPSDLNVFFWLYPFETTIVIRDVLMPSVRGQFDNFGMFNILKYFPLGFLVTEHQSYEGLVNLSLLATGDLTTRVRVPVHLVDPKPQGWPETPDNGNFLLMGQAGGNSVMAKPAKPSHIFRL